LLYCVLLRFKLVLSPELHPCTATKKPPTASTAHATAYTAAHRTLPFGTFVEVTNTRTGRSVIVRINDRGPFVAGRFIDLTPAGAKAIGSNGLTHVELTVLWQGRTPRRPLRQGLIHFRNCRPPTKAPAGGGGLHAPVAQS
jgi:rare lipoprotein A (peptidoglycan hydrolase)